jgi:hypothetical protein
MIKMNKIEKMNKVMIVKVQIILKKNKKKCKRPEKIKKKKMEINKNTSYLKLNVAQTFQYIICHGKNCRMFYFNYLEEYLL